MRKLTVVDGVGDNVRKQAGLRSADDRIARALGLSRALVRKVSLYDLPDDLGDTSAVIWDGSPERITDPETTWRRKASDWILHLREQEIPQLGSCYGGQLLALTLGGRVEALSEREWGIVEIVATDTTDPLARGLPERFLSPTMHNDGIVELPQGGRNIATNETWFHQMGYVDEWTVYIQFHPEMTHVEIINLCRFLADHEKTQSPDTLGRRPSRGRAKGFQNFLSRYEIVRPFTILSKDERESPIFV